MALPNRAGVEELGQVVGLRVFASTRTYNRTPRKRARSTTVQELQRITQDPDVMGGKACIRGMRVTVGMILGLLASGRGENEILEAYPYLELEDVREALSYAAWRLEELEVSIVQP